jgi:ACS family phthalate transporter-like MFS transporter
MQRFHMVYGLAGWQWMFLLEGLPAIVLGVVVYFRLEDRPEDAVWLTPAEKSSLVTVLAAERRERSAHGHGGMLSALGDWRVYVTGLVSFCGYVLASTIAFFGPMVIQASGVHNALSVGLLAAIPAVAGIVAMVLVGRHSDRTRERRWHAAVPLMVAALSLIALPFVRGDLTLSVALLAVATAGHLSSLSVFWTIPSTYLSPKSAAAGIALVSSIGALGGLAGPSMIGYVKSVSSSLTLGIQLAGCVILAGGIVLLIGIPARFLAISKA